MSGPKFPLRLAPVERKPSSAAQELVFARENIAWAGRQVKRAGHEELAQQLAAVIAQIDALGLPDILPLGCQRCDGEVPAHDPDLTADRLCRSCADDYDRALAERRQAMRQTRLALKVAA